MEKKKFDINKYNEHVAAKADEIIDNGFVEVETFYHASVLFSAFARVMIGFVVIDMKNDPERAESLIRVLAASLLNDALFFGCHDMVEKYINNDILKSNK